MLTGEKRGNPLKKCIFSSLDQICPFSYQIFCTKKRGNLLIIRLIDFLCLDISGTTFVRSNLVSFNRTLVVPCEISKVNFHAETTLLSVCQKRFNKI